MAQAAAPQLTPSSIRDELDLAKQEQRSAFERLRAKEAEIELIVAPAQKEIEELEVVIAEARARQNAIVDEKIKPYRAVLAEVKQRIAAMARAMGAKTLTVGRD